MDGGEHPVGSGGVGVRVAGREIVGGGSVVTVDVRSRRAVLWVGLGGVVASGGAEAVVVMRQRHGLEK